MEWCRAISGTEAEEKEAWLPPGFRFHPTDEELMTYYLRNKVQNASFTDRAIAEVDLNKVEPWDLPGRAKIGEKEWYFFSLRDRKYPTGLRTNRATEAGYWKATGKDREITCNRSSVLLGMKKTLVFYIGRAPKGRKTNWVIHEYRLEGSNTREFQRVCKEEWVVCRVFKKSVPTALKSITPSCELDSCLPALESPHVQRLPSSSPSPHQLETPSFHDHCYNQSGNDSMDTLNRHNIALVTSSEYLHLPTSCFSIASTPAPFGFLQQEAAAFGKAYHPLPFFSPSSSHPPLTTQQQYGNYTSIDCKVESLHESCMNSELTETEGSLFSSHITKMQTLEIETTNAKLYHEAAAICHDHLMPIDTCQSRAIPSKFDSHWGF